MRKCGMYASNRSILLITRHQSQLISCIIWISSFEVFWNLKVPVIIRKKSTVVGLNLLWKWSLNSWIYAVMLLINMNTLDYMLLTSEYRENMFQLTVINKSTYKYSNSMQTRIYAASSSAWWKTIKLQPGAFPGYPSAFTLTSRFQMSSWFGATVPKKYRRDGEEDVFLHHLHCTR